jgi:ArsR family transcriptional regulator
MAFMKLKDSQMLFRALADETRLRILNLLCEGELCVCDVMRVLKEPQSKVSRHLSYLRKAGLAAGRKEGLWIHYRLTRKGADLFKSSIAGLCGGTGRVRELRRDCVELNRKKKVLVGSCCGSGQKDSKDVSCCN